MTFLARSLAIAALVWGQPACGQPSAVWTDTGPAETYAWEGYADLERCRIVLNARYRRAEIAGGVSHRERVVSECTTVVHEWGHLAGQQHSPDPRSVMSPAATDYWRCARAFR